MAEGLKRCKDCGLEKPLDQFYRANGGRTYQPRCKSCHSTRTIAYRKANPEVGLAIARRHYLKKRYGITVEEYDRLLGEQGGGCFVCGKPPEGRFKYLAVDHDHETGEVRGLLCGNCNNGVGRFKDDPALLERAAGYLRGTVRPCLTGGTG